MKKLEKISDYSEFHRWKMKYFRVTSNISVRELIYIGLLEINENCGDSFEESLRKIKDLKDYKKIRTALMWNFFIGYNSDIYIKQFSALKLEKLLNLIE